MRQTGAGLVLVTLTLAAARPAVTQEATTAPLPARVDLDREGRLEAHGLSAAPVVLVYFLEYGFPAETNLADLPAVPALKTQIVIDAIVQCAQQRIPQATATLIRLAKGEPSEGIRRILDWDVAQQRDSDRERFRAEMLKRLRRNAIVALGLIGETRHTGELQAVFEHTQDPELRIPGALALASLGSAGGIPYLVREAGRANRTTSVEAAEALRYITGLEYGTGVDAPISRRKSAAKAWKNWWKREGNTFQPEPERILRRRLTLPVVPNPRPPQTARELIDRIAYPTDSRWTIDAYDARERLRVMGPAAYTGLEKIITDKNENLQIRRQAILVYTQMLSACGGSAAAIDKDTLKHAIKLIRHQRWWDRNTEIRSMARECLARLKRHK